VMVEGLKPIGLPNLIEREAVARGSGQFQQFEGPGGGHRCLQI
jgi:hypothetical protein